MNHSHGTKNDNSSKPGKNKKTGVKIFSAAYRILALSINLVAGGLLLAAAYSDLLPPHRFAPAPFFTLAYPLFFFLEVSLLLLQLFIRPRKYALLPVIFLLLSFGSARNYFPVHINWRSPKEGITLLTYNIQSFGQAASTSGGKSNTILDLLRDSEADIICLQEYSNQPTKRQQLTQRGIERVLSEYPYHHVYKPSLYHTGIACYSKYPIKKVETISFDESSNRACLYQFSIDGKPLTLINCHLESNHLEHKDRELYEQIAKHPTQSTDLLPQAKNQLLKKLARAGAMRAKQARAIRAFAEEIPGAVVICGDFNDTPQSYAYRKIRGDFGDAYVSTGFGPGITYHESGMWFRIDHILHNDALRATGSRIIHKSYSDHYPVMATLQWNQRSD